MTPEQTLFNQSISAFCFGYPFIMSFYWMWGGLLFHTLRERKEPLPEHPPLLADYPLVSILLPCFNEEEQAEETFGALLRIEYPNFEIIAINDGSRDNTAAILDAMTLRMPRLRVVHLAQNQGKSTALNTGALIARGEILVGIDGDALLDRHALTWLVRRFQADPALGALTGNPRIRNRGSILGRLQVGEFCSIVGLIKRAQSTYGSLFAVSGVICAFRKRALQDAGWWSAAALTDDVDITWRIQLAGWQTTFEPKALCWILMPETLTGLWRQRLRWAEGGLQSVLLATPLMLRRGCWRLLPVWANYMISILWAYTLFIALLLGIVSAALPPLTGGTLSLGLGLLPQWWGIVLAVTYILQSTCSVCIDQRFEKGIYKSLFWVIWYPLVFWILQMLTAVAAMPRALRRPSNLRGTWVSPDRGLR